METPKLRFKEFNGEWQAKPLSSCLTISNLRNQDQSFDRDDVLSVSDEYGVVNQISLLGRSYAGEDISNYKVALPRQLIYTKSPLKAKPYGIIKANHNQGIVSVLYAVYDVAELHSPSFLDYYFAPGYRTNKYLLPLVRKGAKNTLNISDSEFLLGKVAFPDDSKEQLAITDYFDKISDIIRCIEKEIESLRQVKTAAMISMFPQKEEDAPRVRFKGFDEPWETIKARKLFKTFNERNRPDLPVLSAFQDNRGMAFREDSGYSISHDIRNEATYKHVLPGQFVMHLRSFQGGFAHSSVEGITSPAYTVFGFIDEDSNYDYFWKLIFMSKAFIKRLETITYGIRDGRSISFDEFLNLSFLVPSKAEQQKIAEFFQNLDRQIECQTQILERFKRVKAACLDQMFV